MSIALSLQYLGSLPKKAKKWRLRKPNHLHGWRYGFAFRFIAGLLSTTLGILVMFFLGIFTGWKMTNGILLAGTAIMGGMIYLAEHLRSRVYERVVALTEDKKHIDLETRQVRMLFGFFPRKRSDRVEADREYAHMSKFAERTLDIVIAGAGIVAAAPAMLVIAALVRFDSGGPAIYRQPVKGEGGKEVFVYRFRTRENFGDHKITAVGLFLRKSSLDELPMLFNILGGTVRSRWLLSIFRFWR